MRFGYVRNYTALTDVTGLAQVLGADGIPNAVEDVDLFVLFGGADISPWYYGEKSKMAAAGDLPSNRDIEEAQFFSRALENKIPILGICRGAQLACCLLGGKLWQHVNNHESCQHDVVVNGHTWKTNSYHHQMMIPSDQMTVIGYTPCRSPYKHGEIQKKDEGDEAEIVYHPEYRVLMIQGHPEWVPVDHDLSKLTSTLVKQLLCPSSSC